MTRLVVAAGIVALAVMLAPAHGGAGDPGDQTLPLPSTAPPADPSPAALVVVVSRYQGHTAAWWAARARAWHARSLALHKTLLHEPAVVEALNLACSVYRGCSTLWRRARCESRLDPGAVNGHQRYLLSADSAAGLVQFKPSTWQTTPFASFSIFSPYANALAAGWMDAHGRGGEFECR